jgi:Transposase IS116/IS110/IS902 family
LQEAVEAVRLGKERVERLERTIEEFLPAWSLAPVVEALRALRGVDLIVAVTFVSEIGDVGRFDNPRQLMGYLGLVPSERSTGDTVWRGGITKTGNRRVRHMLIKSAWTYRHPPKIGKQKLYLLQDVPPKVTGLEQPAVDRVLRRTVARALPWMDQARAGTSTAEIAQIEGVSERFIRARLPLALLSPQIVAAIEPGRQPASLSTEFLVRTPLPSDWDEQARLLGFESPLRCFPLPIIRLPARP